jgi:hypothetical protein
LEKGQLWREKERNWVWKRVNGIWGKFGWWATNGEEDIWGMGWGFRGEEVGGYLAGKWLGKGGMLWMWCI